MEIAATDRDKAIVMLNEAWTDNMDIAQSMRVMQLCRLVEPRATKFLVALIYLIKHDAPADFPNCMLRQLSLALIADGWRGEVLRLEFAVGWTATVRGHCIAGGALPEVAYASHN